MSTIRLPGLIDPHVHLRDPGATEKEDFATGTRAAVAGGIVFVLDMPNNPEPTITQEALEKKKQLAKQKAVCDVGFIFGASSEDNSNEFEKVFKDVYALKIYMDQTTGDLLVTDNALLDTIFSKWPEEKPIVVHAEGETMHRAITFAKKHHKKLHVAHVSQQTELETIIAEKEKGFSITCEVTPHHLFLTNTELERLGSLGAVKPPLRRQSDIDFLWKHIDAIDCIATDHAPHTKEQKREGNVPHGVPGLETSLPLMLSAVSEKRISIDTIIRMMHTRPKEIFNIAVSDASYVEVDTDAEYTIDNRNLFTKCGWSPFDGVKMKGKVIRTVLKGKEVFSINKSE